MLVARELSMFSIVIWKHMLMWDAMLNMAWSGTTIQWVLNLVEVFLLAGEIYKISRSFQSSTGKLWELIAHV